MSPWKCAGPILAGALGCNGQVASDAPDTARDAPPDASLDASFDAADAAPVVDTSAPAESALPDTRPEGGADVSTMRCPRGWWRAEHDARDTMKANDGVVSGSVTYDPGRTGSAFGFDGTGGVVEIADSGSLAITGSITVSAWVYLQRRPAILAPIVSRWNDVGDVKRRGYALSITSAGAARWDVSTSGAYATWKTSPSATEASADNAQVVATTPLELARWTHLTGTFDAVTGRLALFVDGAERGSIVAPFHSVLSPPEPLRIGKGLMAGYPLASQALIDETMLFDRVLEGDDVRALAGDLVPVCP